MTTSSSYGPMIKYEVDAVEEGLPTMSDWEFDDSEGSSCVVCGFRPALPASLGIGLGSQYCPQHIVNNTHLGGGFHSHLYNPNSTQAFLEPRIPFQYQINQMLQPSSSSSTSCSQYDDYKMPPHPISPVSEYGPSVAASKPVDVEEEYIQLPATLCGSHQAQNNPSKEAYFPPNNYVLTSSSSSIPGFLSISFDSPISTPYQSPTKHEEEYPETSTTEVYESSMVTEQPSAVDEFMSQDTEIDEDPHDLDLGEMGDIGGLHGGSQALQKGSESELDSFREQFLDATPVAPIYSDADTDKTAPYAVLIHRALMSSPEKKMVLADIYEYFREKIPRFKRVKGRGWMNSIRHNLSMNGAFLKQDRPPDDPGKGYIWVLSDEAIRGGVKSTTRYRKSPPGSKKRTADDMFPRSGAGRRRRKSTRKWTTQTVKNRSGDGQPPCEEETSVLQTPIFHYENVASPDGVGEQMMDYGLASEQHSNIHNALNHDCFEPVPIKEYPNCYASFPHPGMSSRLYIPESDDDLCLEGTSHGFDDQFCDQYALVTDSHVTGCQGTS